MNLLVAATIMAADGYSLRSYPMSHPEGPTPGSSAPLLLPLFHKNREKIKTLDGSLCLPSNHAALPS